MMDVHEFILGMINAIMATGYVQLYAFGTHNPGINLRLEAKPLLHP